MNEYLASLAKCLHHLIRAPSLDLHLGTLRPTNAPSTFQPLLSILRPYTPFTGHTVGTPKAFYNTPAAPPTSCAQATMYLADTQPSPHCTAPLPHLYT